MAVTTILGLLVVFVQDTGLQREPDGETIVTSRYQAKVETDELALVSVDPASVNPVPSYENQLAILNSSETLEMLQETSGSSAVIEVERSEPRFTITDTIDEENNYVSFLRTGNPTYTFTCTGSTEESCVELTAAYVDRTAQLRADSITGGLDDATVLLESLIDSTTRSVDSMGPADDRRSASLTELATLQTKLEAVRFVRDKVDGELVQVSQDSRIKGKALNSVTPSTYGFGFGIGLILGLLIALQLTATDRVIRHGWQVSRIGHDVRVIGSPNPRRDRAQAISVGACIETALHTGSRSVLLATLGTSSASFANDVQALAPNAPTTIVASGETTTVSEIGGDPSRSLIVLVDAGRTTRQQLAETIGLLTAGGARLLGVALVG